MKSKYTLAVVALVLTVLYVGDEQRWFRQTGAAAQGPAPHLECEALRDKPDPAGARACYQRLVNSRDPLAQAEGWWGLGDFYKANEAFKAAVAANKKDPARLTRWGLLYMAGDQLGDASDLFREALELDEGYAPALLGMARVLNASFSGEAAEYARNELHHELTAPEGSRAMADAFRARLREIDLARQLLPRLRHGGPVHFSYHGGSSPGTSRTALPTMLFTVPDEWCIEITWPEMDPIYLLAHCSVRNAPRTFKLANIGILKSVI